MSPDRKNHGISYLTDIPWPEPDELHCKCHVCGCACSCRNGVGIWKELEGKLVLRGKHICKECLNKGGVSHAE